MLKSGIITLLILILTATIVMSQTGVKPENERETINTLNSTENQQQNTIPVKDKTVIEDYPAINENGEMRIKKQPGLEKQFLDKQNGKKMRKQLQEIKRKRNQAIENGESTEKYDEQIQNIEKLILQDDKINKRIQ
ncbi:MAG: hypothetical protein ABII90_03035 [Bacteroidota bacterium]